MASLDARCHEYVSAHLSEAQFELTEGATALFDAFLLGVANGYSEITRHNVNKRTAANLLAKYVEEGTKTVVRG